MVNWNTEKGSGQVAARRLYRQVKRGGARAGGAIKARATSYLLPPPHSPRFHAGDPSPHQRRRQCVVPGMD